MSARYAIYLAPAADSALWRRASGWLARDAAADMDVAFAGPDTLDPARVDRITAEPRHYGFHATIKAPFRLAARTEPGALCKAADAFARERQGFSIDLRLAPLGSFLALVETRPSDAVASLHAAALAAFEPFRAPLTEQERARRLASGLDPRQQELLEAWGYPYVLEQFRLHFTLTGRLPQDEQAVVIPALSDYFAEDLARPLPVDAICIFEQPAAGAPFRILHRAPFSTT